MIQKMFFEDLLYFLGVYLIILIAFSCGAYAMEVSYNSEEMLDNGFFRMLNAVLEVGERPSPDTSNNKAYSKVLLCAHQIVTAILLLNMLIAMMTASYETIRDTNYNIGKRQQLSIMLMLERRLFWLKALCTHSENIIHKIDTNESGNDNDKESSLSKRMKEYENLKDSTPSNSFEYRYFIAVQQQRQ